MFYSEEKDQVKYLKSSVLDNNDLIHAFTTRFGGSTPEPLDSFSLGIAGITDFKYYIEENKKTICNVLNLDYTKIINPEQKHTDNIRIVTSINDDVSNTDGVITNVQGLILLLLFADCTPIILYAPKERVIGVIHAGWRGTAQKIAYKAINLFEKKFNVPPSSIKAAIGPSIGQCCYPVSEEVALELRKSINHNYGKIFKNEENSDKVGVNLKKLNARQLEEAGVKDIDISGNCTKCESSIFYSYRASGGKTGRHGAIASLK